MAARDAGPRRESAAGADAAEADRYEQERDAVGDVDVEDDGVGDPTIPDDANPADAHEQQQVVDFDEDDYR